MQRVNSSVIAAVAHDPRSSVLQVQFRTGRLYDYFGVPRSVYQELLTADSIGKYFNEEIRPRYQCVEVTRGRRDRAGGR